MNSPYVAFLGNKSPGSHGRSVGESSLTRMYHKTVGFLQRVAEHVAANLISKVVLVVFSLVLAAMIAFVSAVTHGLSRWEQAGLVLVSTFVLLALATLIYIAINVRRHERTTSGSVETAKVASGKAAIWQTTPLACSQAGEGFGLYPIHQNVLGFGVRVTNNERRYEFLARNVQANITFEHILGDRHVVARGVWLEVEPEPPVIAYADSVSIPMGETRQLVLIVSDANRKDRYAATTPLPPSLDEKHRLAFGQWTVKISLEGDNVMASGDGTLELNANGITMLIMQSWSSSHK